MKDGTKHLATRHLAWTFLALVSAASTAPGTEARRVVPEAIMAAVQADPRVEDILTDFPEVRLEPEYAAEFDVWVIHFVHPDRGSVGLISVDAESGAILEFSFRPNDVPMEGEVREDDRESDVLRSLLPRFRGMNVVWLSFVLVTVLTGRFAKRLSRRNLDILLLYALAPFLLIIWTHTKIAYTGLFIVTALLMARCLWATDERAMSLPQSNVRAPGVLWFLLAFALILHIVTLYECHIGDVGLWSAIGGQYLLRTGRLPYGTEFGPNCVYGPLMYVVFAPAGLAASFIREIGPEGTLALARFDDWHAMRGVQTTALALDLLALFALYRLARRSADRDGALVVVFVYAISPYLIGMVSELGLERASHIAAAPLVLGALLWFGRPALAGALLGIGAGMLYYPAFLAPLWAGYLWRQHGRRSGLLFLAGFAAVGVLCLIMVITMVEPIDEAESPMGAFFDDTIAQAQFKPGYGNSPLSFWGQYPRLASWGKPTTGALYCLFCLALAVLPRRISFERLIALSAAVLVGTQLIASFSGGTYIGFYLAPLILTLFGHRRPASAPAG